MVVEVYALRLTRSLPAGLAANLLLALPEESRLRLGRFRHKDDAERTLLAEILIRHIILQRLGLPLEGVPFLRNEFGKPYLPGVRDFHFNLSHSGEWIACAVHSRPVGIDVERIRAIDLAVARRYFSGRECDELFDLPEHLRLDRFYELWTCKESFVKASGLGLSLPLRSFSVQVQGFTAIALSVPSSTQPPTQRVFRLYAMEGYRMAVCADDTCFPEHPIKLTGDELAAAFMHERARGGAK